MTSPDQPDPCSQARSWRSAHRDGEAGEDPGAATHIESCPSCRAWTQRADELTRRLRVRPTGSPDVVAAALREWQRAARTDGAAGQLQVARWLLGIAGVSGLVLAAVAAVAQAGGRPAIEAHLGLELLAFEAALSVGFVLAAWRPQRYAATLRPIVATVVVLTLLPTASDAAGGGINVLAEASHLAVWIGLMGLLLEGDATGWGQRGRPRPIGNAHPRPS